MNFFYLYEGAAIITFGVLQHPILHSIALKLCYKVCDQKQKLKLKVFLRLDRDVSGQNIPFIHNMSDFDFFGPSPQVVLLHFQSLSPAPGHCQTSPMHLCICDQIYMNFSCIRILGWSCSWLSFIPLHFCMFQLNCSNLCVFSFTSAGSAKPVCCVS